jgi:hypothetical protein
LSGTYLEKGASFFVYKFSPSIPNQGLQKSVEKCFIAKFNDPVKIVGCNLNFNHRLRRKDFFANHFIIGLGSDLALLILKLIFDNIQGLMY